MRMQLKRVQCGAKSTLGELLIEGKHECMILEDTDRKLEYYPDQKVYAETCIPRGEYRVIITFSNRFKRELPLLVDVPGYTGVRIHPGNQTSDTEGCLLPGTSYVTNPDGSHIVNGSRVAFEKLFNKIDAALELGDNVLLEVT
jgi:hypothetical protein